MSEKTHHKIMTRDIVPGTIVVIGRNYAWFAVACGSPKKNDHDTIFSHLGPNVLWTKITWLVVFTDDATVLVHVHYMDNGVVFNNPEALTFSGDGR